MGEHEAGVDIRWPGNQIPVMVLLDDPMPGLNPSWCEFGEDWRVRDIPTSFVEAFADQIERTGAKGKFSVVPSPGAMGRIDKGIPGIPREVVDSFVRIVRERISPRFDISPELITHNRAMDLATWQPLPQREDEWAREQDERTLVEYISLALQLLRNVGLEPNGVTSPWLLGREFEDTYASAIQSALLEVCGVRVGWYFIHSDWESDYVPPVVKRLDAANGTALVSLVGGHYEDSFWWTQEGQEPAIDELLTADGRSGRLAHLFAHGSPVSFFTHWQSLFSNGTGAGLRGFGELCERINRNWGDRACWVSARELALYTTARAATRLHLEPERRQAYLEAPFECNDFTFAVPTSERPQEIRLDGLPLDERTDDGTSLREGEWRSSANGAMVCVPLRDGALLSWE